MWLVILIVVVIIGSIIGAISSKDGEKGAGCLGGALTSGLGCGYVLLQIFIWGVAIMVVVWLFNTLFG